MSYKCLILSSQGLVFLHEKGVAHRYDLKLCFDCSMLIPPESDCVLHNFLMDPGEMYPEGFHPVQVAYKRNYSGIADYLPRSAVGVKYYFADFGISSHIPDTGHAGLVTGGAGRDRDPPELSPTVPYDPFRLDIFIIGNMFKQEFCDVIISCFVVPQRCSYPSSNSPTLNSFDPLPTG